MVGKDKTQNHGPWLKEWYLDRKRLRTLKASSDMSKVDSISKTVAGYSLQKGSDSKYILWTWVKQSPTDFFHVGLLWTFNILYDRPCESPRRVRASTACQTYLVRNSFPPWISPIFSKDTVFLEHTLQLTDITGFSCSYIQIWTNSRITVLQGFVLQS